MQYRHFGRTGWQVSAVSFGAWAIGGTWGEVDDSESLQALHKAVDMGINFFDTADVYGDGRSERLLAQLKRERSETPLIIPTKAGRRLNPHQAEGYNAANLRSFVERSLRNLETDCLDLLQLHCPPTSVYYQPEVFAALDAMVDEGLIAHYGVSVEKVEEALKAISYPGVKSVQIIFNIFRQRPAELFFREALARNVAVIVRVPLASGLLTGKFSADSSFASDDHRHFNRQGEAFDKGETFSGVDYARGLEAVDSLRALVPEGVSLAQMALRWILMFEAVSCTIPGAKRPSQVEANAQAADLPPLSEVQLRGIRDIYERYIYDDVHHRW